ncbi:response regulator [Clostridium sp. AM58-1XD]|nr:response regulator [Clostridium sp. AM58-1XD]
MQIEALGFCLDENLTILWASSPFYKKTGYTEAEFGGQFQNLRQFYQENPDEFEDIKSRLAESAAKAESAVEWISPIPKKEGGAAWGRMTATFAGRDSNGRAECRAFYRELDGKQQELTESNHCLKKSAGYFKWVLDEYSGNAYIADMENYDLLYINRTSCETLKLPVEKVIGRKCYEVIQNLTSPCPFCTNSCLTEDEFYQWEYYNPFLKRKYLLKDRIIDWEGRKARLELSLDNFSPEYKLEKMDRERGAILRTIPGGFARVDARDGKTILWYGGDFLHLIGYTKEQFENELHSQCTYLHPEDLIRATDIMNHSRETGRPTAAEGRIINRDGTQKIVTMTFSYVSGEDSWDGIESYYSVGIDITREREEQERQRNALEEAYQAARVANAAKTNFLSSMSHDIRTPMNAIMGMTAIAQANLDCQEKMEDCLDKINRSSRHLLGLINEVLDMSKIESGKISFALEQVNLPDLVQTVIDMCRPLISEKRQQFRVNFGHMRHENVITDGDRLRQVLMNILSNAIKYTQEGGAITLKVNERKSLISDKRQYEFICTDNGIGISKEYLPHIFDPFSRADDSRISRIQGTGLGMAITENIVRMMNGTIDVKSEEGIGSVFTVSIPMEVCGKEKLLNGKQAEQRVTAASGISVYENDAAIPYDSENTESEGSAVLSGKKVLLVEDNEINREIVVELLQMHQVRVDCAENGLEAKVAFETSEPGEYSAILMDIQMPVMNGYEAAAAIRRLQRADALTVPIIALTANAFTTDAAKARSVGMNDHLAKPIEIERLLEVLQKWIKTNRNRTDGPSDFRIN